MREESKTEKLEEMGAEEGWRHSCKCLVERREKARGGGNRTERGRVEQQMRKRERNWRERQIRGGGERKRRR